jgi:quercetin dioxygenase-like cupin family protein
MSKTHLRKRQGIAPILSVVRLAGLMVSCIGLFGPPGIALATDPSGFSSTFVGPTVFDDIDVKTHTDSLKVMIKTWGSSDVYVVTNTVAPGGHSGWHTHPGPSVVSVIAGTATYYDGDDPTCTPHVVHAGDGFIDQGGGHVHMVRNEGSATLTLVAFQIIPEGAVRRIGVPNPGNCLF